MLYIQHILSLTANNPQYAFSLLNYDFITFLCMCRMKLLKYLENMNLLFQFLPNRVLLFLTH